MDTKEERSIFDELPNLTLYQEIILSTITSTGKIVLFLILPTNKTLNVYPTTPGQEDNGVHEITTKLLAVIHRYLLQDYSVVHRLSLQRLFHADPFFLALFLIFLLQRHGRYLLITEKTILHYKLSFVESCIAHHDEHLGRLHIRYLSSQVLSVLYHRAQQRGQSRIIGTEGVAYNGRERIRKLWLLCSSRGLT